MGTAGGGAIVSITVRRDNPDAKAGVKLEQDANGRVRVKNIAKNGMFGDSELEIGDTILSVNRERLSGKNGPEVLLKAAKKHHTITVSVRKGAPGGKDSAASTASDSDEPKKKDKKKWLSMTTSMTKNSKKKALTTKKQAEGTSTRNADGSLTISVEKKKNSSSSSSNVGLEMEVRNEKLLVKSIEPKSIFAKTELEVGDAILSVNDMCFRKYPDAEYAARVMKKARVTVTLAVEKSDGSATGKRGGNKKRSKRRSSSPSSSSSTESSSSDSEHEYEFEIETEFKIEKYRPVTIIAPKMFSGENVGLQFKLVKTVTPMGKNANKKTTENKKKKKNKNTNGPPNASGGNDRIWVYVSEISDDSIFKDTPLRVGDKIISINDVDMRGELSHADSRVALRECVKSTECVTMVVLKEDESTFLEKSFCLFDASTTNLDWMASATNLDYLKG